MFNLKPIHITLDKTNKKCSKEELKIVSDKARNEIEDTVTVAIACSFTVVDQVTLWICACISCFNCQNCLSCCKESRSLFFENINSWYLYSSIASSCICYWLSIKKKYKMVNCSSQNFQTISVKNMLDYFIQSLLNPLWQCE